MSDIPFRSASRLSARGASAAKLQVATGVEALKRPLPAGAGGLVALDASHGAFAEGMAAHATLQFFVMWGFASEEKRLSTKTLASRSAACGS
jgi:hypothetical protein